MPEEWKPIPRYEGMYAISNHGRVKSLARTVLIGGHKTQRHMPEIVMSLVNHYRGYHQIFLRGDGKHTKFFIHRLVATAFIGPSDKAYVNHIDGNKQNNHVGNLEWATERENSHHYHKYLRSPLQPEDVLRPEDLPF